MKHLSSLALPTLILFLSACAHRPADSEAVATITGASTGVLFEDDLQADWQDNWFLDGKLGTVKHWNNGLYLAGGPITKSAEQAFGVEKPTEYNAHHIVLWTKQEFEGDIRISYEFNKQPSSEMVNLLFIQAQGVGKAPYEKDIYAWRGLRDVPGMDKYFTHMDLMALSLREDIRCRRYPWKDPVQDTWYDDRGLYEPILDYSGMPEGTPLSLEVEKRTTSLRLVIRELGNGSVVVEHTWDLAENPKDRDPLYLKRGRIGLRLMGGHKILMRNFKVERI